MSSDSPRRKRIRLPEVAYVEPFTVALVTLSTASRRRLFAEPDHVAFAVAELRRLHGERWRVLGYCLMPDHVHLLILSLRESVVGFVRLFKGRVATRLRGLVEGAVWQRSFHDHLLRRNEDISSTLRYLFENPVRAGLVPRWSEYPWCGSLQWPSIGPEFFASNPANILWAEMLEAPTTQE